MIEFDELENKMVLKLVYYGPALRAGFFELFIMNDEFRHSISSNYKESELIKMARDGGMHTLLEDGFEKVRMGETTLD